MKILSIKQMMEMFGVTRVTIYNWIKKNDLPHYKIGETVRFNEQEVIEWFESKKRNK